MMMSELTPEERAEVIRVIKEQHPGAGPGADVEMFFKTKPLAFHFSALIARGLLKDSREATDTYLRSLPKDLLEMLVTTLDDWMKSDEDKEDAEEDRRGADIIAALVMLISTERRVDRRVQFEVGTFTDSEDELMSFARRLAKLAKIETLRRVGVVKWVDRYTLLKPVTEKQPRRSMTDKPHAER
jgi:hypothetical protein